MTTTANDKWKPDTINLEHWKIIEGFENYKISDTGFVRNRNTQKFKKLFIRENGYFYVHLWKNGKNYTKTVNRLVAMAFI